MAHNINIIKVKNMWNKNIKAAGMALFAAPLFFNCVNDDIEHSAEAPQKMKPVSAYSQGQMTFNPSQFSLMKGDFNGDGKKDLFYISNPGDIKVRLSNGSDYNTLINLASAGSYGGVNYGGNHLIGDINGDGKSDIFYIGEQGDVYVRNSTGSSLGAQRKLLNAGAFGNWISGGRYYPGDFNGDGKSDILFISDGGRGTVRTSDGANYTNIIELFNAGEFGNGRGSGRYFFGDFDGDLKSDVYFISNEGEVNLRKSTGTSVGPRQRLLNAGAFGDYGVPGGQYNLCDFNGDRKVDLLFIGRDGDVHMRTSNGYNYAAHTDLLGARAYGTIEGGQYFTGDFNGDSKSDLFFIGNHGDVHVRTSNGYDYWNYKKLLDAGQYASLAGGVYQ